MRRKRRRERVVFRSGGGGSGKVVMGRRWRDEAKMERVVIR